MSFLLGDDYGSSSSNSSDEESEHELDAALPRSEPKQSDGSLAPVLLPSADSVLAEVSACSASFLAPQNAQSAAAAAAAVVEIDTFKENERAKALQAAERTAERQSRRDGFAPPTDELAKKRPRAATEADEKEPSKKEKKDAKERVKAQRTKGQAGIGSDFRSWKSETEMSMRQQFD